MANILRIFGVLALVILNGFFVAAELALVKIRDTQIEALVKKGNRKARIVRTLAKHLDATISAIQFGVTLASLGVGMLVEPVFKEVLEPVFQMLNITSENIRHWMAISTGFFTNTFLLVVFGELCPKSLAIRKTESVALWTARPLSVFAWMATPFVWLLHHSAQFILNQIGVQPVGEGERGHSEEELRLMFTSTKSEKNVSRLGREIMLNALDLKRRIAREVMRPRKEIVAMDTTASIAECLDLAEKTRFSRFPLCEGGDLDKTLGVVHFKDLVAMRFKARSGADLSPTAKKLIYVPETARLEKLLQVFLDRKLHLAIVVDEYGGTVGMVTLENILEELVGQIQDEFDQEKPLLTRTAPDTWELAGELPLHELSELVQEHLQEEGITTVSGWVTHKQGGFPKRGDRLTIGSYELHVVDMDEMRVAKLRLHRITGPEPPNPGGEEKPQLPAGGQGGGDMIGA